jgi:acid phosphatase (class A)
VEDYDKNIAAKLIKDSAPVILELKKYHNRPRPYELDKKLTAFKMKSMETPSYPSGHSVQGILIAKVLGDKYPKAKSAFVKTGENISYSRRVAHAHYKSDSKMGEKLGNSMYKHIKNKI